jgi:23S rRNA C2498 (ribose-2'-O)-methylase RlmM
MKPRPKTGGRTKGTPNRNTAETKELIQNIVNKELPKLGAMLEQLEPNDRINAIAKLLPYILPKQNEVKAEIKAETKENQPTLDLSKLSLSTLEELERAYCDDK